ETIDPVIVNIVVLAGHSVPIDRAVRIDMFGDDLVFGIDKSFEAESISAFATGEHIICCFESGCFIGEYLRLAVLRRDHLSSIAAAQKNVVPSTAIHPVAAESTNQKIIASTARQPIVTRSTPDQVLAAAAPKHIVACFSRNVVIAAAGEQHVSALGAINVIVTRTAASQPCEEVLEVAIVVQQLF